MKRVELLKHLRRQGIENMVGLNIDREGMKNLNRALREQDEARSFDRCSVGGEGCQQPAIKAHAVPRSALKLIAQRNKVYATNANPPQNPLAFINQDPLSERSIEQFTVGKWACRNHDLIFNSIDSNSINLRCTRNLFLIVYRTTLRAAQLALRTVGRIAVPMVDPVVPTPKGISEDDAEKLRQFAIVGTFVVAHLFRIKAAMDRFWRKKEYHRLDYRVTTWETKPVMAGAGILWNDGPPGKLAWSGSAARLPGWLVILPQKYGQAIITACPDGFSEYAHEINGVTEGKGFRATGIENDWTSRINITALKFVSDLAIQPDVFQSLTDKQTLELQSYLASRTISTPDDWQLPNLLKVR